MNECFTKGSYEPVATSDDGESSLYNAEKPSLRSKLSRHYLSFIVSGVVVLGVCVSIFMWFPERHMHDIDRSLPCGTTAAVARARGCVFEMTGSCWVPPDCYDPITEQEFIDYTTTKQWKFYKDYHYTQEVPLSEVRLGEGHGYYVGPEYHLSHCGFLLKKLHRVTDGGRKADGYINRIAHTSHCVQWMLDPPKDFFKYPQWSATKFPRCGQKGGFNLDGLSLLPSPVNGHNVTDAHTLHANDAHRHGSQNQNRPVG